MRISCRKESASLGSWGVENQQQLLLIVGLKYVDRKLHAGRDLFELALKENRQREEEKESAKENEDKTHETRIKLIQFVLAFSTSTVVARVSLVIQLHSRTLHPLVGPGMLLCATHTAATLMQIAPLELPSSPALPAFRFEAILAIFLFTVWWLFPAF